VFHRDIKPSNIVRLTGGNTIKVTDFGIAHIDGSQHSQQTRVGTVLGTPQYMSPEQAMGEKVDGRSDLFSVGIVLYQLLTGQAPFEATSLVTLAHRIAKQEPTSIDKVRRDVPPALRRVIERCLKKQPEKRFQTGAELADALTRVISDLDQEIGITGRPRIVLLRVKWTLTMAVIVAVTMAITAALVTQRQYAAMMRQVMDYGSSLASFLATENAAPTLAQEWVNVDVSVRDIMESQWFTKSRSWTVRVLCASAATPMRWTSPIDRNPGRRRSPPERTGSWCAAMSRLTASACWISTRPSPSRRGISASRSAACTWGYWRDRWRRSQGSVCSRWPYWC
jgi:serine/threonine-protein kinase